MSAVGLQRLPWLTVYKDGHNSSPNVMPKQFDRPLVVGCSINHKSWPLHVSRCYMSQTKNEFSPKMISVSFDICPIAIFSDKFDFKQLFEYIKRGCDLWLAATVSHWRVAGCLRACPPGSYSSCWSLIELHKQDGGDMLATLLHGSRMEACSHLYSQWAITVSQCNVYGENLNRHVLSVLH